MVNIKILVWSIFLLVILSYSVDSFGVSSPYWDENPLYLNPGESKEFEMVLQNMVGDQDITVIAELNSGSEIASLMDESTTYNIPIGNSNTPVKIKINIPEDAKSGQEAPSGTAVGGALSTQTLGFLVLVIALIILVLIIKYFHKKKENKNV
ncbi:hypothetical protein J4213_02720 [Candidatus Woesearchaeota archaeon]|nr:hypothetical protein [Candidatus Woesearchaeota archaeon]